MSIELSNLDIDLTGVDLSRPILPRQTLRCRIGDVKLETPEGKTYRQLIVPLTLEQPGQDTNGKDVGVGFGVTDRIMVDPFGGLTQAMINERLARLQIAALKLEKPTRFVAADLIGKEVLVTFDIRTDKTDPTKLYQDIKRYSMAP